MVMVDLTHVSTDGPSGCYWEVPIAWFGWFVGAVTAQVVASHYGPPIKGFGFRVCQPGLVTLSS